MNQESSIFNQVSLIKNQENTCKAEWNQQTSYKSQEIILNPDEKTNLELEKQPRESRCQEKHI